MEKHTNDHFLHEAIEQARVSMSEGGIPIGAVLVRDNAVVSKGRDRCIQSGNPILQAEIDCIQNAGNIPDFNRCTMYVTLVPGYLGAGALVSLGIENVIVGETYTRKGAQDLLKDKWVQLTDLNVRDCRDMMKEFILNHPDLWNNEAETL